VVGLPPSDRREDGDESRLDEQDLAWWTKQLGRAPSLSAAAAASTSAPTERSTVPTTELPAFRTANGTSRSDETRLSLELTDTLAQLDAQLHDWTHAQQPRPRALHEHQTVPVRVGGAAWLLDHLVALRYSPHHPYATMRRAGVYTLRLAGTAAIAWLVASLLR
jgi:hypothetical protein